MRLIDADALRKNMELICMGIMAGTEPYNAPLTEIDNAPTFELSIGRMVNGVIVPIKRPQGEWIYTQIHDYDYWECSSCGELCTEGTPKTMNFCPNCGADMRTEDK